jgi:phage terminase small subunit
MNTSKLTIKQEAFAQAYIETGNASEAYRRAYQVSPSTKPNTVEKRACELLKHGKVAGRIAELQAGHQKRHDVTIDRIVGEYVKIAFADAGDYFDWGPNGVTVKDKSELTPEQRSVVAEVSQTVTEKGGTIRVKLHDKLNALEKLGKHLGMFIDKHEVAGKDGGPIETREMSDRDFARWLAMKLQRGALANGKAPTH